MVHDGPICNTPDTVAYTVWARSGVLSSVDQFQKLSM